MWKIPNKVTTQEGNSSLPLWWPEEFRSEIKTIGELAQSDQRCIDAPPDQEELVISRSSVLQLEIPYFPFLSLLLPPLIMRISV